QPSPKQSGSASRAAAAYSLRSGRALTILEAAIQVASRPREGIIPPEQLSSTEHQPHFCPS
ncbi:MAG TPA: hypothetical protein VEZ90_10595, partial [Blastocatellia bacterium]|nr:hypothetical protein [Blastocatellia bacterium]